MCDCARKSHYHPLNKYILLDPVQLMLVSVCAFKGKVHQKNQRCIVDPLTCMTVHYVTS